MSDPTENRLNKHLAHTLGVSRREADIMIERGRVHINETPAMLGARFSADDSITLDGKPIATKQAKYRYIALHKPAGYLCSRKSQGGDPTIYELLPGDLRPLKPVGRLDRDSSGLILLTNDGDFAFRMTHPKFSKTKLYEATLDQDLAPLHQQMISDFGVDLEDGRSQLGLMRLNEANRTEWQVTMREGRNRQVRRTFSSLGYTVTRLHRTHFGDYSLGDIKPGEYELTDIR